MLVKRFTNRNNGLYHPQAECVANVLLRLIMIFKMQLHRCAFQMGIVNLKICIFYLSMGGC